MLLRLPFIVKCRTSSYIKFCYPCSPPLHSWGLRAPVRGPVVGMDRRLDCMTQPKSSAKAQVSFFYPAHGVVWRFYDIAVSSSNCFWGASDPCISIRMPSRCANTFNMGIQHVLQLHFQLHISMQLLFFISTLFDTFWWNPSLCCLLLLALRKVLPFLLPILIFLLHYTRFDFRANCRVPRRCFCFRKDSLRSLVKVRY